MSASETAAVGFVTVREQAELGTIGGYLILNSAGRPLEFHCTTPVKPTRAQEILYGATLKPVLLGEQIAAALVNKQKNKPICICTDNEFVAAVRSQIELPTVLILERGGELPNPALWQRLSFGDGRLAIGKQYSADETVLRAKLLPLLEHLNLQEPFGRIHEALEEAQKTARPAAA